MEHLRAAHLGHDHVKDDEGNILFPLPEKADSGGSAIRQEHRVSQRRKDVPAELPYIRLVVDHQHGGGSLKVCGDLRRHAGRCVRDREIDVEPGAPAGFAVKMM